MAAIQRLADLPEGARCSDFVVVEWTAEVGDHWIAPLHAHERDDEAWYVLSGQLGFRLGPDEVVASAGAMVVAPRGMPHTYRNAGTGEARYLLVMTPRIARLIDALHQPGADVPALFAAHDSVLVRDD